MSNVIQKNSISSDLAQRMVEAAVAKATALGVPENVAVLDDGGNLKAFARMDGAPILSIEIAQNQGVYRVVRIGDAGLFQLHPDRPVAPSWNPATRTGRRLWWRLSDQDRRCHRRRHWRQRRDSSERRRLCSGRSRRDEVIGFETL